MTINERQTAGASYILSFYQEVQLLTHEASVYNNIIKDLEAKHGQAEAFKKAPQQEKDILISQLHKIRSGAYKAYMQYHSIAPVLKIPKNNIMPKLHNNIKDNYIISRVDLNLFVSKLNDVLVSNIIQELLETSQSIINQIYQNDANDTAGP